MDKEDLSVSRALTRDTVRSIILATVILFVVLAVACAGFGISSSRHIELKPDDVSYEVQKNDGTIEHYKKPYFAPVCEGETLTVTISPIGSERAMEHTALIFSLYHCFVNVYEDDELIYEQTEPKNGGQIGHRYYRIALSPGYETKTIKIVATVKENDSFSAIAFLGFVRDVDSVYAFEEDNTFAFVLMLTMLIISLFMMILSGIRSVQNRKISGMFHIATFTVAGILWYMGFRCLYVPFISNEEIAANAEYYGLFFAPLPLALFARSFCDKRPWKQIGTAFAVFFAADFIVMTILNFAVPGIHYVDFIHPHRMMFLALLAYTLAVLIKSRPKGVSTARNIYIGGFMLMSFLAFLELARFYLSEQFGSRFEFLHIQLTPLVLTVLFLTVILYYGSIYSEDHYLKIERENLRRLAYVDPMTGAPNRMACTRKMQRMEQEKIQDFAIVFVDVNFLKMTNDTWGHEKGDELLCMTSDFLKDYFSEHGFYGRWGGDEFIACHYGTAEEAAGLMAGVEAEITRANREGRLGFDMSISWGCSASTAKNPITPEEALHRADERMYRNKEKIHALRTS